MQLPEGFVQHVICTTEIIGTKCAVNFSHRASSTPDCNSADAGLHLRFPTLVLQQIAAMKEQPSSDMIGEVRSNIGASTYLDSCLKYEVQKDVICLCGQGFIHSGKD